MLDRLLCEGPDLDSTGDDRPRVHPPALVGAGHDFTRLLIDIQDQFLAAESPDASKGVQQLRAHDAAGQVLETLRVRVQ